MNEQQPLYDLSPMPFGKYRGTAMQDVPASYLHWLWTNGLIRNHMICDSSDTLVAAYIRKNLQALKQELPDAIWS